MLEFDFKQKMLRKRKITTLVDFLSFFVVSVAVVVVIWKLAGPRILSSQSVVSFNFLSDEKPKSSLAKVVEDSLSGAQATYAVGIKNLKTGESDFLNENKVFPTASIYKLWVMATVFQMVKNGDLSFDEVLNENLADLNQFFGLAPEDTDLSVGDFSLSVREAVNQMITISHNPSSLALTKRVTLEKIKTEIKDLGLSDSEAGGSPTTTVADTVKFFELLYSGKIVDEEASKAMLEILKQQQLSDELPRFLPKEVVVAHKTGNLGPVIHDGGIVFGKLTYIIVVFSESDFPPGASERIANISKAVFDYFQSQSK